MHLKVRLIDNEDPERLHKLKAFLQDPEVQIRVNDHDYRTEEQRIRTAFLHALGGCEIDVEIPASRVLCKLREAVDGDIRLRPKGFSKRIAENDLGAVEECLRSLIREAPEQELALAGPPAWDDGSR